MYRIISETMRELRIELIGNIKTPWIMNLSVRNEKDKEIWHLLSTSTINDLARHKLLDFYTFEKNNRFGVIVYTYIVTELNL